MERLKALLKIKCERSESACLYRPLTKMHEEGGVEILRILLYIRASLQFVGRYVGCAHLACIVRTGEAKLSIYLLTQVHMTKRQRQEKPCRALQRFV